MGGQGTKAKFQSFLSGKGLTLTKYNKMAIEAKATLYREYQQKGAKHETVDTRTK